MKCSTFSPRWTRLCLTTFVVMMRKLIDVYMVVIRAGYKPAGGFTEGML